MADEQQQQQQQQEPPPTEPAGDDGAQKLFDDPVTGEKVSKSELKRRTKQRKIAEDKAQAKAVAESKAPATASKNTEEELNPSVIGYPSPES